MELTVDAIKEAVGSAERQFGEDDGAAPLRLGLFWAQQCRMNGEPMPTDEQVRKAADLFCEAYPPAAARDVRYWLRLGLGRKARTETAPSGLPTIPTFPLK